MVEAVAVIRTVHLATAVKMMVVAAIVAPKPHVGIDPVTTFRTTNGNRCLVKRVRNIYVLATIADRPILGLSKRLLEVDRIVGLRVRSMLTLLPRMLVRLRRTILRILLLGMFIVI